MIDLSQHGMSHEEIEKKLKSEWLPLVDFRLDLLRNGSKYKTLNKKECSVWCDSTAEVKYGATATVYDTEINQNTDMLQPVMFLEYKEKLFEFKLVPLRIVYLENEIQWAGVTTVIEAMDSTVILQNNSLGENLLIKEGTLYTSKIEQLIKRTGFDYVNIEPSNKSVAYDREEWEIGENLLKVINDLAREINYRTIGVDRYGVPSCKSYKTPEISDISITYDIRTDKNIIPIKEASYDRWNKPNVFVANVFTPDMEVPITATYTNTDPSDPSSTVNNPFEIIKVIDDIDDIADYESLYGLVKRQAMETSQSYEYAIFRTDIMPHHEVGEILSLNSTGLSGVFEETAWSIDSFGKNGKMTHKVRRVF